MDAAPNKEYLNDAELEAGGRSVSNDATSDFLHVPRHSHRPQYASPLRASQQASSGSEEATPTASPDDSVVTLIPSSKTTSFPSSYYHESQQQTPSSLTEELPLYPVANQIAGHFLPAESPSAAAESSAATRWLSNSTQYRLPAGGDTLESRTETAMNRKPSFGSSTGGATPGGYASSVDAEFYSAPPSRLVSRTPTPVTGVSSRIPSPDVYGSTESDDEDSDYGNTLTGWKAALFGLGRRSTLSSRGRRAAWKGDYHVLGTRNVDSKEEQSRKSRSARHKNRSKSYDVRYTFSSGDGLPEARKPYRRRRQRSSQLPTPMRIVTSLLSKTFRTFFGPIHPLTILVALALIAGFVTSVTMLIMYILNPDKEPLPWRSYCQQQMPFPHAYADALAPVNVFVGVMTVDSKYERRNIIRNTYARHTLPVDASGKPTANVQVKFILGKVRKSHASRIALEMEAFNDIIVLDMDETQSARKTHGFYKWAAENATIPFLRPIAPARGLNYTVSNTYIPSATAPGGLSNWDHSSQAADDAHDERLRYQVAWKKVDYVVKADDDSFIVLDELERHLRVAPRKMTYWGYLIKNWFMGGEAYALSYDLVHWMAHSTEVSKTAKGKEDTRTPQWIAMHPNRSSVNWVSEHCWIYDHPKAGTPYSHGFLFPDYVEKIKLEARHGLSEQEINYRGGEKRSQSYSTVTKWHHKYRPPRHDLSAEEQVEALIEGGGRWSTSWVRGPDGSTSETWVPYHDLVYESDDKRLQPSATNAQGSAVLAANVGLEVFSGLPIYGAVEQNQDKSRMANETAPKRDLLQDLSSLPRKILNSPQSEDKAHSSDQRTLPSYHVIAQPSPKDGHGEWSVLHARRYLNRPHGGTVIVHYLKKTEWWLETALALNGRGKLWNNGAGGRGKEWRMGGSPLVRHDGYIFEGRSAPRRAIVPTAPFDEGETHTHPTKASTDQRLDNAGTPSLSHSLDVSSSTSKTNKGIPNASN